MKVHTLELKMEVRLRSAAKKEMAARSDLGLNHGSEQQHATHTTGRGQKRGREDEIENEENSNQRPEVHIDVPENLMALLVDDWENITSKKSLVALPADYSANEILTAYFEEEKHKYRLGSAEADLFLDAVTGCKDYFEKCVGRILLYTFERQQYAEFRKLLEEGKGSWEGKNAGDVYGAEHLCRLFVSLPELIAETNMGH